jgi:hypothetical protein
MFFFPLAANVVVCTKFDVRKEGKATTCSYNPRRRRRGGKEEGGGEEVKMKRRK